MATLTNNTGSTITSLSIGYDFTIQNPTATPAPAEDVIVGHRVYWSLTGLPQSWNPVGNFGTLGLTTGAAIQTVPVSFSAPVATWANGTNAFILWLDDNSNVNPDGLFALDNIAFTPVVPEPTAGLLALGACGVFGLGRRRVAR